MKKEDHQKPQQETEMKNEVQKNDQDETGLKDQQKIGYEAGLGRDLMSYVDDLENAGGRQTFTAEDDDLKNEDLNAANDR